MKIFGLNVKNIAQDKANHIVYCGYVNFAVIMWTLVFSVEWAMASCGFLALLWAGFEIYQGKTKTGTQSFTDFLASCYVMFIMLVTILATIY